jgi:hypothetical protein
LRDIAGDQEKDPAPLRFEHADRLASHPVGRIGEQRPPILNALEHDKVPVAANVQQHDRRQSDLFELAQRGAKSIRIEPAPLQITLDIQQ